MSGNRVFGQYAGKVILAETAITAQTAAPTLVTDGSALSEALALGKREAAPRYLDILVRLTTPSDTGEITPWVWVPEANSAAGRWFPMAAVAVGATSTAEVGSCLKVDCPRNASRVYLQVSTAPSGAIYAMINGDD